MRKLHILTLLQFSAGKGSNHAGRLNQTALPHITLQCSAPIMPQEDQKGESQLSPAQATFFVSRSGLVKWSKEV
jgi:hypothetical protein